MNRKVAGLFLLAGLFGIAGGWLFSQMLVTGETAPQEAAHAATPDELLGRERPGFRLGRTDGQWVSASDFDGQVVLVNFWATWCEPCLEEMPMLDQLHRELSAEGFQVVGIALDDVQKARAFVAEMGLAYPTLVGMADVMDTGRRYGNRAGLLPYSVLVDRDGTVRWTQLGAVTRAQLLTQLQPLL